MAQTRQRRLKTSVFIDCLPDHSVKFGGVKQAPPVIGDFCAHFESLRLPVCRRRFLRRPLVGVLCHRRRFGAHKVRSNCAARREQGQKTKGTVTAETQGKRFTERILPQNNTKQPDRSARRLLQPIRIVCCSLFTAVFRFQVDVHELPRVDMQSPLAARTGTRLAVPLRPLFRSFDSTIRFWELHKAASARIPGAC